MSADLASTKPAEPAPNLLAPSPFVAFHDLGWNGYLRLLKLRGDRSSPRMIYLDGTVHLMSPSYSHEDLSKRLGLFVVEVAAALDIPCTATGRTTFRRKSKRGGVEGDETFYLANADLVRGKRDLDLREVPPPDLAVEAVHSHKPDLALRTYRRLGVPEVWIADSTSERFLVLGPDRRYDHSETSRAFPFLSAAEVDRWAHMPNTLTTTEWLKSLRAWIADVLAPRLRADS